MTTTQADSWTVALRNIYNDLVNNRRQNISISEFGGIVGIENQSYAYQILVRGNKKFPSRKAIHRDQRFKAEEVLKDLYNVNPEYFRDQAVSMYIDDKPIIGSVSDEDVQIRMLKEINVMLAEENKRLREKLANLKKKLPKT